jgi:ElaB/YqjD/DUF883 family membrane-anchored ribosome-binding protein
MNSDLQDTHKSTGSPRENVSRRPLSEDVLQSAVDAAKDEVLVVDASQKSRVAEHVKVEPHRLSVINSFYQRMEDRATRYVLLKPMKASILAAGAGALLAVVIEHSLKRLVRPLR